MGTETTVTIMKRPETVIVSRHHPTVQYLREQGIAPMDCRVIDHATAADVAGMHVVGNLPLGLAAVADRVTTVALPRPQRDAQGRMEELDLTAVRTGAGKPETYRVTISRDDAHDRLIAAAARGCRCLDCDAGLTHHMGDPR